MTEETGDDLLVPQEQSTSCDTAIDDMSIILKTQEANISRFQLCQKVKLLHFGQDIEVAVVTISSTTSSIQLHNRLQSHGYYKVSIEDAIVDEASLMITNMDDDPPQLLV